MLMGPWPRITGDGRRLADLEAAVAAGSLAPDELAAAVEGVVAEAIAAQVEAGMGLVTDGSVRWADPVQAQLDALRDGDTGRDGLLVRAWRAASGRTDVPVAQAVPGPWTLAIRDVGGWGDEGVVTGRAGELADALAGELEALEAAGCPVVQVLEPGAVAIGADDRARSGFLRAHRRLLRRAGELHTMLAVVGGSAADAGAEAVLGAPYASFLFDLVAGPDNWSLVRAAPGERGIVCAALEAGNGAERRDQAPELVWAAGYAASANGRGMARVGLANASVLASLTTAEALAALEALGRAAAFVSMPVTEAVRAGLDPRVRTRKRPPGRPSRPPGP
jgi:hypothetical protein